MTAMKVSPLARLIRHLDDLVTEGIASNGLGVIRKALKKYKEDQVVERVLRAMKEHNLCGDLDELTRQIG